MPPKPLPTYKDTPSYPIVSVQELYARISSHVAARIADGEIPLVAADTETYYNYLRSGAVIRTIAGAKNNEPFMATFCDGTNTWCVIDDLPGLQCIFDIPGIVITGHNFKFDELMLGNIGVNVACPVFDTMNFIHLIDEEFECRKPDGTVKRSKGLKDLAYHYGIDDENAHMLEDLVKETRRRIAALEKRPLETVSYKDVYDRLPALMVDYACHDVIYGYKLCIDFYEELIRQELIPAYDIDRRATRAVLDQERRGIRVDMETLAKYKEELSQLVADTLSDMCNELGKPDFQPDSDADLVSSLELYLGIKWEWYTDKRAYSTDKSVLEMLASRYPEAETIVQNIKDYRHASKMLSTYVLGIEALIHPDGRIHTSYNIAPFEGKGKTEGATKTGRLSSNDPNLQNFPKKPVKIRDKVFIMRNLFIADDDCVLVFFDFDQEEYRLLAHYGKDEAFMHMIHEGKDVHKGTAAQMFGIPYDEVTDEQRGKGKTLNFA